MKKVLLLASFFLAFVAFAAPGFTQTVDPKLNPPGPPAPTKKTLDEIPGSWHRVLPAADRFKLVMPTTANPSGEAVLDKETGLVWEKAPDTFMTTFADARQRCSNKTVGGRKGWRLPEAEELASLVDPTVSVPGPVLPAGHPFANIQANWYISASIVNASNAGVVYMNAGVVAWAASPTNTFYFWCVRGGQGFSHKTASDRPTRDVDDLALG